MFVIVTASRGWKLSHPRGAYLRSVMIGAITRLGSMYPGENMTLMHGDASGGDRLCASLWPGPVLPFPANWTARCQTGCKSGHRKQWPSGMEYCPRAGMIRNEVMVRELARYRALGRTTEVLAFVLDDSKGATGCARMAARAEFQVRWFFESSR